MQSTVKQLQTKVPEAYREIKMLRYSDKVIESASFWDFNSNRNKFFDTLSVCFCSRSRYEHFVQVYQKKKKNMLRQKALDLSTIAEELCDYQIPPIKAAFTVRDVEYVIYDLSEGKSEEEIEADLKAEIRIKKIKNISEWISEAEA